MDYRGADLRLVEQQVRAKLADWRGLLERNIADARCPTEDG